VDVLAILYFNNIALFLAANASSALCLVLALKAVCSSLVEGPMAANPSIYGDVVCSDRLQISQLGRGGLSE
jgi:hypothetical protein